MLKLEEFSDNFRLAISWINSNEESIRRKEEPFDYPDYWGMPEKISHELYPDEVDWIQENTYEWWSK